ncbi:MAG: hypothetical protein EOM19_08005, partial [Candidatus Moranbacteria bacterium]|nr:hypothetical protein [Candidatus Moranbacteria bacterium]
MATQAESQANISTLVGQYGIPESFIQQQLSLGKQGPAKGQYVDAKDMQGFIQAYQGAGQAGQVANLGGQIQSQLGQVASQQYQFDPSQYLPGIQTQAESIYAPQQAQLEAIRQLQQVSST